MLLVGRQISPEPPSSIKQTMATPNRLRSWRLHGTATPLLGFAEPNGPTMLTRSFNPSTPGDNRRGSNDRALADRTLTEWEVGDWGFSDWRLPEHRGGRGKLGGRVLLRWGSDRNPRHVRPVMRQTF